MAGDARGAAIGEQVRRMRAAAAVSRERIRRSRERIEVTHRLLAETAPCLAPFVMPALRGR